ncbi:MULTISPECIES: hypothetical protein [Acinetobacter]|uniref:Uncharacterized protein n=1 Tax=Acinetobacter chengduensis TaxID=2420890 RepID=A0ABX9TR45_9GAMM|nr:MULTISPECIES: hypothetical protein [Acinetobacter]RLL17193.1 hypothetical protein D9K81_17435 [Acinetobacter chengduensis]
MSEANAIISFFFWLSGTAVIKIAPDAVSVSEQQYSTRLAEYQGRFSFSIFNLFKSFYKALQL